jgi:uncharacterized protein YoxC
MTTYKLSNIKQLIDLNGDAVNFNLNFNVEATNGETFEALVVTQETLDSQVNLDYQIAKGSISGSIKSDRGEYQNYFLILKSEKPTEVTVSVDIENLSDNIISNFEEADSLHREHLKNNKNKSWLVRNRKTIVFSIVIFFLLLFLLYYYKDIVTEHLNGGFEKLNESIDVINVGISNKLSEIDGMNSKIDCISNEINGMKNESTVLTKIDGLTNELNEMKGGLSDTINTKFEGLKDGYESISSKLIEPVTTEFGEIKDTLNSIKIQVEGLTKPAVDGGITQDIFQKVKNLQIPTSS